MYRCKSVFNDIRSITIADNASAMPVKGLMDGLVNEVSTPTEMLCSIIGLDNRLIGPKRSVGARGIKAFRLERSATLIETGRPSIETLVSFDRIVTAASGHLFLRGFSTHCRSRSYKGDDCKWLEIANLSRKYFSSNKKISSPML